MGYQKSPPLVGSAVRTVILSCSQCLIDYATHSSAAIAEILVNKRWEEMISSFEKVIAVTRKEAY